MDQASDDWALSMAEWKSLDPDFWVSLASVSNMHDAWKSGLGEGMGSVPHTSSLQPLLGFESQSGHPTSRTPNS